MRFKQSTVDFLFSRKHMAYNVVILIASANSISRMLGDRVYFKKRLLKEDNDGPVPIKKQLYNAIQAGIGEMYFPYQYKQKVEFFLSDGLRFLIYGSPWFREALYGKTRIGIPLNYNFVSISDIDTDSLGRLSEILKTQKTTWPQSEAGKNFLQSLILSDDAKKYAFSINVHLTTSIYPLYSYFFPTFIAGLGCLVFNYTYKPLLEMMGPRVYLAYPLVLVAACGFLTKILEFIIYSFVVKVCEKDVMADVYSTFKKGAPEYYEKLIQRNKAMRALMEDGKKYYNSMGEAVGWSDLESYNLEKRLKKAKERLEKIENAKQSESL